MSAINTVAIKVDATGTGSVVLNGVPISAARVSFKAGAGEPTAVTLEVYAKVEVEALIASEDLNVFAA